MINKKEILVFDFETTGLSAFNDEILEIGAVKYVKNDNDEFIITDELSLILNTNVKISPKITEITGIDEQMQLDQGVSQEEGFHRLSALISDETLLIAYNIQFDLGFLQEFFRRYYDVNYKITNDCLDVMAVYKDRNRYPHRLESAVSTYAVSVLNTHRALDDCKATYEVLVALNNEKNNINKYINVVGYNKKYGVSGPKLSHIRYVAQYGGYREIERFT